MNVLDAALSLRDAFTGFPPDPSFKEVAYILNPLLYAFPVYEAYCERFAPEGHRVEAIFVGMNPGPWGMAQTGVPFGSPDMVRDFLCLQGEVRPPLMTHPKRPIEGVQCTRNEVSGQRFWGGVRRCFGTPEAFFARFFVANYCPLVFQNEKGANLTPDACPPSWRMALEGPCDAHLRQLVDSLKPRTVIGVGKWAALQAERAVNGPGERPAVATLLHPSPASPLANKGWLEAVLPTLASLGHAWPTPTSP